MAEVDDQPDGRVRDHLKAHEVLRPSLNRAMLTPAAGPAVTGARCPTQPQRHEPWHLLLAEGQFGARRLCVTWVECQPGSQQALHRHLTQEQAYVIVRGQGQMLVGS